MLSSTSGFKPVHVVRASQSTVLWLLAREARNPGAARSHALVAHRNMSQEKVISLIYNGERLYLGLDIDSGSDVSAQHSYDSKRASSPLL